jgi:hypothetical protein
MTHYFVGDREDRNSPLKGLSNAYRFGRTRARNSHGRATLKRINGYLKNLIEEIANAKLRRMQRELELRGIRFDPEVQAWETDFYRRPSGSRR